MAGPRLLGVKDVINPFEEAQKSVMAAGDIYRQFEEDRRNTQIHNEKLKEVYRAEDTRNLIKDYDPNLGKVALSPESEALVSKRFADERQRYIKEGKDTAPLDLLEAQARKEAVLKEDAERIIYNDLRTKGVDPATIAAVVPTLVHGYTSRADLEAREAAQTAAINAAEKERIANAIKLRELAIDEFSAGTTGDAAMAKTIGSLYGTRYDTSSTKKGSGYSTLPGTADLEGYTTAGTSLLGGGDYSKAAADVDFAISKLLETDPDMPIPSKELQDAIIASTTKVGKGLWGAFPDYTSSLADKTEKEKVAYVAEFIARDRDRKLLEAKQADERIGSLGLTRTKLAPMSEGMQKLILGGVGVAAAKPIGVVEAERVTGILNRMLGSGQLEKVDSTSNKTTVVPRPNAAPADGSVGTSKEKGSPRITGGTLPAGNNTGSTGNEVKAPTVKVPDTLRRPQEQASAAPSTRESTTSTQGTVDPAAAVLALGLKTEDTRLGNALSGLSGVVSNIFEPTYESRQNTNMQMLRNVAGRVNSAGVLSPDDLPYVLKSSVDQITNAGFPPAVTEKLLALKASTPRDLNLPAGADFGIPINVNDANTLRPSQEFLTEAAARASKTLTPNELLGIGTQEQAIPVNTPEALKARLAAAVRTNGMAARVSRYREAPPGAVVDEAGNVMEVGKVAWGGNTPSQRPYIITAQDILDRLKVLEAQTK